MPVDGVDVVAAGVLMHLQAIWLELQDAVHAVDAMTTRTPEETV